MGFSLARGDAEQGSERIGFVQPGKDQARGTELLKASDGAFKVVQPCSSRQNQMGVNILTAAEESR